MGLAEVGAGDPIQLAQLLHKRSLCTGPGLAFATFALRAAFAGDTNVVLTSADRDIPVMLNIHAAFLVQRSIFVVQRSAAHPDLPSVQCNNFLVQCDRVTLDGALCSAPFIFRSAASGP